MIVRQFRDSPGNVTPRPLAATHSVDQKRVHCSRSQPFDYDDQNRFVSLRNAIDRCIALLD